MLIPMVCLICAYVYSVYVNVFNREIMDTHRETEVDIMPIPSEKELALHESYVDKPGAHTVEESAV